METAHTSEDEQARRFSFRPLETSDLPMLHEWLGRPHWTEWWARRPRWLKSKSNTADTTCKAWTSSTDGSAIVGHHDRVGSNTDNWAKSWNFSHQSAGCSQEALVRTGGSGRFYCFAAN